MKTHKNKNNVRQTRSKRQRGGTPEQDRQLIDAIKSRDLPRAEALLDAGANVNASGRGGNTALMWATIRGNEEIVRMLLDRGANVNASNSYGNTALVWASAGRPIKIVRMLLDAGANVNASNSTGHTALIWASRSGNEEIVQMLLKAGANVDDSGVDGKTALMMARERGKQEIIQIIETHIQRKKDLNNLEMVTSAVQQKRVQGISPAMETVFNFGPGTGPTLNGFLAPKGGKRKTRKTRQTRSKRQRGRKL